VNIFKPATAEELKISWLPLIRTMESVLGVDTSFPTIPKEGVTKCGASFFASIRYTRKT